MTSQVMRALTEVLHREEEAVPTHPARDLAALTRELLTGLSLDFGAAFPQILVPGLKRPRFALGRSPVPLPWRATWLPTIQLIFLMVGSSNNDPEYQSLRAALWCLGRDRLRIEQLLAARDAEQMLEVLTRVPLKP